MKLTTLFIAAALAAGCTVQNNDTSALVATKLIQATASGTSGCTYDPATNEAVFGTFDPAFGYEHAVVVENRLPDKPGDRARRGHNQHIHAERGAAGTPV